jgi:hypothetical protein
MPNLCIYCGRNEANERDHIPPQSFFPKPRPSNLITVPSCSECNREFGKIDEIVRNLLTSIDTTEIHPAVVKQLADKRNRSLGRDGGIHSFNYFLENISLMDRYSEEGIYLGKHPAFELNTIVMDNFMERIGRGLLFHYCEIGFGDYEFNWKLSPPTNTFNSIPEDLKRFILSGRMETFGDKVFSCAAYTYPGKIRSLWLLRFYDGIEFMLLISE